MSFMLFSKLSAKWLGQSGLKLNFKMLKHDKQQKNSCGITGLQC